MSGQSDGRRGAEEGGRRIGEVRNGGGSRAKLGKKGENGGIGRMGYGGVMGWRHGRGSDEGRGER